MTISCHDTMFFVDLGLKFIHPISFLRYCFFHLLRVSIIYTHVASQALSLLHANVTVLLGAVVFVVIILIILLLFFLLAGVVVFATPSAVA